MQQQCEGNHTIAGYYIRVISNGNKLENYGSILPERCFIQIFHTIARTIYIMVMEGMNNKSIYSYFK